MSQEEEESDASVQESDGEDGDVDNTKNSYTILHDKTTATEVAMMSWCPHMDLLALVTKDNRIIVHRLSWQQLFTIEVEEVDDDDYNYTAMTEDSVSECSITAIAWRQDGKMIAVGKRDGSLELFSVENRELVYSCKGHSSRITTLCWTDAAPGSGSTNLRKDYDKMPAQGSDDRTPRFFGELQTLDDSRAVAPGSIPIPNATLNDGKFFSLSRSAAGFDADKQNSLNILVSGDDTGEIQLRVYGRLKVACIDTKAANTMSTYEGLPTDRRRAIVNATLSQDLAVLTTVINTIDEGDSHLVAFNSSVLRERASELKLMATHFQHIDYLFLYLSRCVHAIQQTWTRMQNSITTKFKYIGNMMMENEETGTANLSLCVSIHLYISHYRSLFISLYELIYALPVSI